MRLEVPKPFMDTLVGCDENVSCAWTITKQRNACKYSLPRIYVVFDGM